MKKREKKVVLIAPTYNEAENVEKFIKVVFNSFPVKKNWNFHILIVDGNSPDNTADIVRKMIPDFPNLHLILEKEKTGLGTAYLKGMDYAFDQMRASYVFQFDADLQHDPLKIRDFITLLSKGNDIVIGTRYRKGGGIPEEWTFVRKFLSRGGNLFTRIVFMQKNITDWTSGYSAISKKLFKDIRNELSVERGYNFQISLKKSAVNKGYIPVEIPYVFKERDYGTSKLGPEYLFRALYYVVTTRLKDIMSSYFFRVAIVGSIGASIQTLSFYVFYSILEISHLASLLLSIELAIVNNFTLNNNFSFKNHKIGAEKGLIKNFLKFNLLSCGSITVQFLVNSLGVFVLGKSDIVVYSLVIIGIILGLITNYYFYTRLIWKIRKK
ncbi:hypothetical protein COV24_01925 [candidate division WWE3 bacterium CG10_big_fil_rev_8_21_14_0_10_32_10]|uniref:Glycosyltransferase family 2 protein n=1 Tax=candidate division WWE3 bacterium CG10_big_fil_rev_8_21_14_0_10_32_10 TaxID=1975090 RepID=A0A2H0RAS8_UNCKA|nr:MAG: hypothetical protein COV24_01925 [candidate division WWE3 bacterium CG10_big_fil_rev_8_21_14_0_10_32_10]